MLLLAYVEQSFSFFSDCLQKKLVSNFYINLLLSMVCRKKTIHEVFRADFRSIFGTEQVDQLGLCCYPVPSANSISNNDSSQANSRNAVSNCNDVDPFDDESWNSNGNDMICEPPSNDADHHLLNNSADEMNNSSEEAVTVADKTKSKLPNLNKGQQKIIENVLSSMKLRERTDIMLEDKWAKVAKYLFAHHKREFAAFAAPRNQEILHRRIKYLYYNRAK